MLGKDPLVSVIILTYNQERYIAQGIESILSQKTEYSYEIVIGVDGGTDNTRMICESYASKYPNIIVLPDYGNQGVTANFVNCVRAASGKYLMNCDGDDYWHNPNKIQLQVDFMERHPECIVCHTDLDVLNDRTGKVRHRINQHNGVIPPEGMIQNEVLSGRYHIVSSTECIRKESFDKYIPKDKYIELGFLMEDWPTLFILSAYGEIRYIPVSTATYRVGQESLTNCLDYDKIRRRYQSDKVMAEFLYSLFPNLGPFNDAEWYDTYVYHSLLVAAYKNNDFKSAKEYAQKDPQGGIMVKMANWWITFEMFRLYRLLK